MTSETSKLPRLLGGVISVLVFVSCSGLSAASSANESNDKAGSNTPPKTADQMVCQAGKILTVLNENYSKKSLTCLQRFTGKTYEYNNLADIYAEGWIVVDINNVNTWVFTK
ncbi:MAG: hypothetical protein GY896_21725 [Gammaproteobacteria bacterium]|nr:hypothetical protein [Gammaproteobacteria bacterium]